ncbi:hypothetical protein GQR58_029660 [Nymphon striatum]|nr:hypothetical protein GQR58_029660 [Nymphon striatum]
MNAAGSIGIVQPVQFSVDHGFYSSTQSVTLTTATPSATIRYTVDGSTPTATSGTALSPGQSINVSSTTTLRAVAYRTSWIPSPPETRTYFFVDDILDQSSSAPSGWPSGAVNGQVYDYGMDPNIVNGNEAQVAASLTSIPSISIVTDQANLTSSSTGIYSNPTRTGLGWERAASVELIDPTGAEPGFDINAGLRIRGGGSRRTDNPKHSLRLYFRDDYGDGALEYPLFGSSGGNDFESLGLATGQNGSWSYRSEPYATWMRDPWVRETQAAMGQPNTRSRYYHVYLNGQYWGLYYSQERLSNGHGVEYFGGDTEDYDVIGGNWLSSATASDGSVDALASLYPLVADLNVTNAEYTQLEAQVNLENLANYFLLHYFSGDWDASPMGWNAGGDGRFANSNNWRMFRNRRGSGQAGKWLFYDHDSEFTFCGPSSAVDADVTPPWNLQDGVVPSTQVPTPAWLHEALLTHPSYQRIFRDQVRDQLIDDGLWPTISAPTIAPASGSVPYGTPASIDLNGGTGTLWYTTDGTDPQLASGSPSPTATQYTGPFPITGEMILNVRSQDVTSWSPLTSASYSLSSGAQPLSLVLNEYNAVGSSKFLGGGAAGDIANGSDQTFGRVVGNGGDWLELVVLEDGLDIRNWTVEIWHLDFGNLVESAILQFTNDPALASLQGGTIITISEDIADDLSFDGIDDWHINFQATDSDAGQYITPASQENFAIDKDNTQIAIFDGNGDPIMIRTGEGTVPDVLVNSEEVFKLEAAPTSAVTYNSTAYADGTSSTWGLPNTWANGAVTQDLSDLRTPLGDVDCDGVMTIGDALAIAQYTVGTRAGASCPIVPTNQINLAASDVDRSGATDITDALLIAQCTVGVSNVACP